MLPVHRATQHSAFEDGVEDGDYGRRGGDDDDDGSKRNVADTADRPCVKLGSIPCTLRASIKVFVSSYIVHENALGSNHASRQDQHERTNVQILGITTVSIIYAQSITAEIHHLRSRFHQDDIQDTTMVEKSRPILGTIR